MNTRTRIPFINLTGVMVAAGFVAALPVLVLSWWAALLVTVVAFLVVATIVTALVPHASIGKACAITAIVVVGTLAVRAVLGV